MIHVANNPVYQNIPATTAIPTRSHSGGTHTCQINIPLSYPNPLNPSADPESPFYPYSGPEQAKYTAIESFTFTFPASEFFSSGTESLPSTQVYWTRTSPLLPWMGTPSTGVSLLFVASGSKVEGWEGLNRIVRDVIEEKLPAYKEAPLERTSKGGGVTSWNYFTRPEVFRAYLDGAVFPLPDPPSP